MSLLRKMPPISVDKEVLVKFGDKWKENGNSLSRTPPYSSSELGNLFDAAVGKSLAEMLGGITIEKPNANSLVAPPKDCVEVGPVRIVGGVRPQNFDVGYRPDGVRFAFDSKTLNDTKSINKNWQNMINDLSTEATTVHTRFPHAVVAFMVVIPEPAIAAAQRRAMIETLERLARRVSVRNESHLAEVIAMVLWNPKNGEIDVTVPDPVSPLRIENFSKQVEAVYFARYKGLPPHAVE